VREKYVPALGIKIYSRQAPPDDGLHPARDEVAFKLLNRAGGQVRPGVRPLTCIQVLSTGQLAAVPLILCRRIQ